MLAPPAAPATGRRWLLLATVSVALLLITLDNSILYTALPTLTEELGASATEGLWIINAYPLVMAGLLLGAGSLGDRIGHRRMFVIGLAVFGAASLLAAFSPDPAVLIGARAVLAVGAAAMMPATLALVRLGFTDVRERNLAIAVWGSVSVVGMALGPILSGLLLEAFWWGSVFLVNVPIVLATLIIVPLVTPPNDPDPARSWDLVSSLYALVALSGLVLAIKESVAADRDLVVVGAAVVAAGVGAILFARRQGRLEQPLLEFSIFGNRAFSAGVMAAAVTMFAAAGFQLITTQRFQLVADYTPLQAGLLVAALALGSLPSSLLAGAYLHLIGLRVTITTGLVATTSGALVAGVSIGGGLAWVLVGLVLIGLGIGMVMAVASTAIVGNAPARRAGMASSVEEASFEFGSLFAVALLGTLLTSVYSASINLHAGAPPAAGESLAEALRVAGSDRLVLDAAYAAFDEAYRTVAFVIAGLVAVAAIVLARTLRSYGPGTESTLSDAAH